MKHWFAKHESRAVRDVKRFRTVKMFLYAKKSETGKKTEKREFKDDKDKGGNVRQKFFICKMFQNFSSFEIFGCCYILYSLRRLLFSFYQIRFARFFVEQNPVTTAMKSMLHSLLLYNISNCILLKNHPTKFVHYCLLFLEIFCYFF